MMKTNAKRKNSAAKKLIPAAGMLALSASMLATSTYAWFTMNKTVTVTGMEMRTQVGANLLISDNNLENDYSTAQLSQGRKALLEPVSSTTGADGAFWYTVDALGNGDARTDAYTAYNEDTALTSGAIDLITVSSNKPSTNGAGKEKYDDDFNSTYTISSAAAGQTEAFKNAYGYVDYVFYLKGTADGTNNKIKMTKCNLIYNNAAITSPAGGASGSAVVGDNVDRAWRAAVFCSSVTGGIGEQASNATSGNLQAILTLANAANHSDVTTEGETKGNYAISANSAPTKMTLGYNTWKDSTNKAIASLSDKDTGYYMVTVRVWLEGEDTTCTSKTYAQLSNAWKLDCEFSMEAGKNAVENIGSVTPSA